jgi:hypothetical protein
MGKVSTLSKSVATTLFSDHEMESLKWTHHRKSLKDRKEGGLRPVPEILIVSAVDSSSFFD